MSLPNSSVHNFSVVLTTSHFNANPIALKFGEGEHCSGKLGKSFEVQKGYLGPSVWSNFGTFWGCTVYCNYNYVIIKQNIA